MARASCVTWLLLLLLLPEMTHPRPAPPQDTDTSSSACLLRPAPAPAPASIFHILKKIKMQNNVKRRRRHKKWGPARRVTNRVDTENGSPDYPAKVYGRLRKQLGLQSVEAILF